jgi:hypothetical protein
MTEQQYQADPSQRPARRRGLTINRHFTAGGADPYASVTWSKRTSRITNPDGTVVFEMADAEIPATWSQVAADIMVSKYFRKAGVPRTNDDGTPQRNEDGSPVLGPEHSAKQVISRLAETWRWWGEQHGYFATPGDAQTFEDELKYMLVHQMAAPNSPQWFNTGLSRAYGITGPAQGHYYVDPADGEVKASADAFTHPQVHACYIQPIDDDLVGEGGIRDLWVREARLFKFGSGTGTNFSAIRGEGEPLSGGGTSSGLMSFLKVGDRAAGGEDGLSRPRPPRHRAVHHLEGGRGEEGRRPDRGRLPLRLQRRRLRHRLRPKRQQFRPRPEQLHQSGRRGWHLGSALAHRPEPHQQNGSCPRPLAHHRRIRLAMRRPRCPIRHHD